MSLDLGCFLHGLGSTSLLVIRGSLSFVEGFLASALLVIGLNSAAMIVKMEMILINGREQGVGKLTEQGDLSCQWRPPSFSPGSTWWSQE